MLEKTIGRWRYRKLPQRVTSVTPILDRLIDLHGYAVRLSLDTATYRDRVRYRIVTKTEHAVQLLYYTQSLQRLIESHSMVVDRFAIAYRWPQQYNLDTYLQDQHQHPLYEKEFATDLFYHLTPIIEVLEGLRFDQISLYRYYEQSLQYISLDWIEVIDALCALQLGVPHERRNASPAHSRRSWRQ